MSALARTALVAAAVAAASGCALTSKSDPVTIRYFSPEPPTAPEPASRPRGRAGLALRLGRVSAGAHIEEKIIYRSSAHELGFYEDQRWTEEPEEYLERALARELFEARGLGRVVAGRAPTLEVQLAAFEEVRSPRRVARVRVTLLLHHEGREARQETLTFDRPIDGPEGRVEATAAALGAALSDAVQAVADRVVGALEAEAVPEPGAAAGG